MEDTAQLRLAVFVAAYPSPSLAFIRREILELESRGVDLVRFSVRRFAGELADEGDRVEAPKTRYILDSGAVGLLCAAMRALLTRPLAFLRTLAQTVRLGWRSDRGVLVHLVYLLEACVLLKWCIGSRVDHVHAHFGTNSTMVPMLCRLLGGPPYSFTVHGPEEFDRLTGIALSDKIKHAKFVVAITNFCRSQLYRWTPYADWGKIRVVRCGLDSFFLDAPATSVPDAPRLLSVGRLCEQKGQILLLEAARLLREEGRRFELVLVGDGPMRSDIESAIDRYGLQDCCELTGWASSAEVRERMSAARCIVLPSFAEGLPVVIMEAMALGRPVISTWIAGVPELLEQGKSGWLVPAGSVEALADAMRSALDAETGALTAMGRYAAERVRSQHDIQTEAAKLAALLRGE